MEFQLVIFIVIWIIIGVFFYFGSNGGWDGIFGAIFAGLIFAIIIFIVGAVVFDMVVEKPQNNSFEQKIGQYYLPLVKSNQLDQLPQLGELPKYEKIIVLHINQTGKITGHSSEFGKVGSERDTNITVYIVTNVHRGELVGYFKCNAGPANIPGYNAEADIIVGEWPEGSVVGVYRASLSPGSNFNIQGRDCPEYVEPCLFSNCDFME